MENLADCFTLLLLIFLTKFNYPFTGRWAQAGTLKWKYCPVGGNISSFSFVLLFKSPAFPGLGEKGGAVIYTNWCNTLSGKQIAEDFFE